MSTALLILCLLADLSSIKSEPNLEKRSGMALDYAASEVDAARDSYNSGDLAKYREALEQIRSAVELSYQSLQDTGRSARKDKHFKHAELRTRELLRRLDGLRDEVNFDDRAALDTVRTRVSEVHDQLLQGIMSKKK